MMILRRAVLARPALAHPLARRALVTPLERYRESDNVDLSREVQHIQSLTGVPERVRSHMQATVERRHALLEQIADLADVLSDHDLAGPDDSDVVQLLRGRNQAAPADGLVDPTAEVRRLEEICARLRARLEEVEAVLGANPC